MYSIWNLIIWIAQRVFALFVILCMHSFILFLGVLTMTDEVQTTFWTWVVWALNIPALIMSKWIYEMVIKYGIVDFITARTNPKIIEFRDKERAEKEGF